MEFLYAVIILTGIGHLALIVLYCLVAWSKSGGCRGKDSSTTNTSSTPDPTQNNRAPQDMERAGVDPSGQQDSARQDTLQPTGDHSFLTNTWISNVRTRIRTIATGSGGNDSEGTGGQAGQVAGESVDSPPSYEEATKHWDRSLDPPPSYQDSVLDSTHPGVWRRAVRTIFFLLCSVTMTYFKITQTFRYMRNRVVTIIRFTNCQVGPFHIQKSIQKPRQFVTQSLISLSAWELYIEHLWY